MIKIVLASSSPYRRELLSRFNLPFYVVNPDIDESPRLNETAKEIVSRCKILFNLETINTNDYQLYLKIDNNESPIPLKGSWKLTLFEREKQNTIKLIIQKLSKLDTKNKRQ